MKCRPKPPQVFGLDLNCAIYHCVHKIQRVNPYTEASRAKWEADLIEAVLVYIQRMNAIVQPSETLYIAIDGVAPMAKIRQQRVRRFKSAIGAQEEARIKAEARGTPYSLQPRWDTNAITPGTAFMANLATALRAFAKRNPAKIVVSPSDEPGEGEQKIMAYIREHKQKDIVVYGLDADLIVLALWTSATREVRVDLFREEVEFNGAIKMDASAEEQFLYMNVNHLASVLHETYSRAGQSLPEFLVDFVGMMNLLGNDFVPHGMGVKIRDGGIEMILDIYKDQTAPLVQQIEGVWRYNVDVLRDLCAILAAEEPRMILKTVKSKLEARIGATNSKDPEDQAMCRYNDTPVVWAAESVLVERKHVEGYDKARLLLKSNWANTYDTEALWEANPEQVAKAYLEALAWTLAYYSGSPVDMYWYYPWLLPPRMETITKMLETQKELNIPNTERIPLKPIEQLAMVLPQSSFSLLPSECRDLVRMYPYAWPTTWTSYSFGRRFLWECEPLIPLIQPMQIKNWLDAVYEGV